MALEVRGITKSFAGIRALDDVDLDVDDGELAGLIGPNGAGKTTLFNCVLGMLKPDAGTVTFDGVNLGGMATHRRARLGIGRTFQRLELFGSMTPREHVVVTARATGAKTGLLRDLLSKGRASAAEDAKADEILELVGLRDQADVPVEALSLGLCRLVELARTLTSRSRLILLDEPSSGLDASETAAFAEVLRTVRAERELAMLVVEHDLELVLAISTRLFVMDQGSMIASGDPRVVIEQPAVRQAYLGVTA